MTLKDLTKDFSVLRISKMAKVPRTTVRRYLDGTHSMQLDSACKLSAAFPGLTFRIKGSRRQWLIEPL